MLQLVRCTSFNPIVVFYILFLSGLGLATGIAELLTSALVDDQGHRYINIEQTLSGISIDGLHDDEDWEKATFQKHFLQREPDYGEETSEETQVA
jgi:hypothetical protein